MGTVQSSDGTRIGFDRMGDGPPLVLVDGALCYRKSGPMRPLAEALAKRFAVFLYDRRGRGESGDTAPYSVEKEIDDIAALIEEAGGSAGVYGISSGAALALEAANHGLPIERLALYEAPFVVDDSRPPMSDEYRPALDRALAADRPGDAVKLFMRRVGVARPLIPLIRFMPAWSKLKGVAHTLPYDDTILGDTGSGRPLAPDRWTAVTMPTLAIAGDGSPEWMRNAMRAVAELLPNAEYRTLKGQTHMVKAKALAPTLTGFFAGDGSTVPK
jgi:pimeloyl-ACP methyl ester carboxylesterase